MTSPDPVFAHLADLRPSEPNPELSASLRAAAYSRLRPRPVHAAWSVIILVSTVSYLGWAVHFASSLY
jgi:hypothetical protein